MGEKGEGFTGTTIKDTWTKTKGSGRLGWGGEMGGKAENYLNRNKNQKYFKKVYIFTLSISSFSFMFQKNRIFVGQKYLA